MCGFPLVAGNKNQVWQEVVYEKRGFYCKKCFRQGHTKAVCRVGDRGKARPIVKKGQVGVGKQEDTSVWKEVGCKSKPDNLEGIVIMEEGEVVVSQKAT